MELKERIVQEASLLFFENGIRNITMSDIANHLGISKRTLYEIFKDKEDLLEFCVDERIGRAGKEMRQMATGSENVISSLMQVYRKHLDEVHNTNKSVIHELKKYHPRIYRKIECYRGLGVSLLAPLCKKGVEQGLIRTDVNFEICLWLLESQFKMLMEGDFIPLEKFGVNEFVRTIILNFVRGIATPKGNEMIDKVVLETSTSENN
jgi:Transcriptional regulator